MFAFHLPFHAMAVMLSFTLVLDHPFSNWFYIQNSLASLFYLD